jgi:molybdate transport system ATP-binding protein
VTFTLRARVAARSLDISLTVAEGETIAILGPNGAGKSTTLDLIAGLLRADDGEAGWTGPADSAASHSETLLTDTAHTDTVHSETLHNNTVLFDSQRGVWLPPHRRGVALLAQEPLLFPHLSVLENVAFAPRSAGRSADDARMLARSWLADVEALELASSRPSALSGGQAQRVAIARALAAEPRLLLLDEPLAALDVAVAPTLRRMLRRVLSGRSAILVTHEVLDALTLADRVVVLNRGVVVEVGQTREVLEHPRHPFTAELAGLNLVTGVGTATGLTTTDGAELVVAHRLGAAQVGSVQVGAVQVGPAQVGAAFRPTAVKVQDSPTGGRNVFPVTVTDLEPRGDLIRVRAGRLFADVTPGRAAELDLAAQKRTFFVVDPDEIAVYPL